MQNIAHYQAVCLALPGQKNGMLPLNFTFSIYSIPDLVMVKVIWAEEWPFIDDHYSKKGKANYFGHPAPINLQQAENCYAMKQKKRTHHSSYKWGRMLFGFLQKTAPID